MSGAENREGTALNRLIDSLKYTFSIYSHPFEGFWFMKSQKRATYKTGLVLLLLLIITTAVRIYTTGYIFSSVSLESFSVWLLAAVIIGLIVLYCTANWALTTLLDGKGTYGEIFTSVMYSLTPVILVNLPMAALSNVITNEEASFYTFINTAAIIWSVALMLIGNMQIQDFTMTKSIMTFIATLLIMVIIAVIGILFINLCQQVYVWVLSVVREVSYRL